MNLSPASLSYLAAFLIVALASRQIGRWFTFIKMPLITGFLIVGIVAGPYLLNLINADDLSRLRFIDDLALAYIALSAGSELVVRQIKSRLRTIRYVTIGLVLVTLCMCGLGFLMLAGSVSFFKDMPYSHLVAGALLFASIMVARSPSSAIAIVNELKAKGPFTKTVLGVIMINDVVVIILYSISSSIAEAIFSNAGFNSLFVPVLLLELLLTVISGYFLGSLIRVILSAHFDKIFKTASIMAAGLGMFVFCRFFEALTHEHLSFCVFLEPLLVCMIAGFIVVNYSVYRTEMLKVLHDIGPYVYLAFFTLTGASLQLNVLQKCWLIAIALFGIRLAAVFIGSFSGSFLARETMKENSVVWMCYVTQAGVGLGLAKQVANQYSEWGSIFATIAIAVIVLNQVIGPPLFKWALHIMKEAGSRNEDQSKDDIRDAIIFGLEGESLSLARLLQSNDWEVKIATNQDQYTKAGVSSCDVEIHIIMDLNLNTLKRLGVGQADAIVAMLSDEENYRICELVNKNFGIGNFIVRLNQHAYYKRFHELGAVIVEPRTAIVNLLDQFVRSPSAARLLLGLEQGREVFEFELRNPDLKGVAIRDLHLPLDLHILSIRRHGELVVSVGFTRLQPGDWLTVVGSRASLEQMMRQFGESREEELLSMLDITASKSIYSSDMGNEVKTLIHDKDIQKRAVFERLVDNCTVMDIHSSMTYEQFFLKAAEKLYANLNVTKEYIYKLLMERENESSTAFRPDLAIPHIILEGQNNFHLLIARCREGIYYSELAPGVQAVFLLAGTVDQRDFHLYSLASIANAVQQPYFHEKWMKANNETALRNIVKSGRG